MKKLGFMKIGVLLLSLMILLAACGGKPADNNPGASGGEGGDNAGGEKLSVGYYINGTLGDKSFFDSVQRGLDKAVKELGLEAKTVEGGLNQADWAAGIESMVASKKYDVILVGSSQTIEIVKEMAEKYPDQKFIFFDDAIDGMPNVYSMTYSQSEGSFLAGAFAGLVTTSTDLKGTNPDKAVGFVGGMDIPIINDFRVGFEQGAKYIDPDMQIVSSFIGDFADAPKGKELALAQYKSQKVDILYTAAGGAGLGALEAGNEVGMYSIGVDSNQNPLYPGSVLTSMLKNLDTTTYRALEMFKEGTLPFGTMEVLGVKEGGVGLAKDDLYEEHVPQAIKDKMLEVEKAVADGEVKVESILK